MPALLKGFLVGEGVPQPKQEPLCSGAPSDPCPGARRRRSQHPTKGSAGGRGTFFLIKAKSRF